MLSLLSYRELKGVGLTKLSETAKINFENFPELILE